MKSLKVIGLLGALAVVMGAEALEMLDVPISSVSNKVYLTSMSERPWWNKAWQKRAAILVSNMSDIREERAIIDFVFDPGEKVDPSSVRVVTPWEAEVGCVAEPIRRTDTPVRSTSPRRTDTLVRSDKDGSSSRKNGQECPFSGSVRIIFETSLRERENKPFFVYYNRQGEDALPTGKCGQGVPALAEENKSHHCPPPPSTSTSPMTLSSSDSEVYVNNGVVEVVFDNLHRTPGLIKRLRVNASQARNELLWRTTEFAWQGFEFSTGGNPGKWSKAMITVDNAFRKTVTFTNANCALDFTLYAGQPRVDYSYRLKPGVNNATIGVSWACGGGVGYDDLYYTGAAGKILKMRAALDHVTDCMPQPEYYGFPWISSGWYALVDRQNRDVVGMVFDRKALGGVSYIGMGQSSGERMSMSFGHAGKDRKKGDWATSSGALVATVGEAKTVADIHAWLTNPPKVFVAKAESVREIPVKVPVLDRDFCINCNVGGWCSSSPLAGDEWAPNIIDHIRALGANTILLGQLSDYGWQSLPISKDLFDRLCAHTKSRKPNWKAPEWKGGYDGRLLKRICAEAHSNGMAVCTWHDALPGFSYGSKFNADEQALCREMQALYPQCGVDSVFNALGGGEGVDIPGDYVKKFGNAFWKWPDPDPFFASRKQFGAFMKEFYDYSHKVNPNAKVMVFNSDNGELGREMCMPYYPGVMDTLFCEFVANDMNWSKIKHVAKRLRGYFDNVDAKTIHAHYYYMQKNYDQRICQLEMPFACGINGFSQESMTYENFDRDLFEISADFNRFALYTKLGDKAAKMGPVKNLAVFRDMNCFEEDCRKKRTFGRGWWEASRHDARVNAFAEIPNYNYDIVHNPFFKADSLSRYKVVYIPDDEVLTEELAKEALKFVEQGGGLVVEGETGMKSKSKVEVEERNDSTLRLGLGTSTLTLRDGEVKPYGAGRIVWTKAVLTDSLMKRDAKAIAKVKALVASVGGEAPFTITKANGQECPFSGVGANGQECPFSELDGILQASDEGMMLGVYNQGKREELGKVSLNSNNQTTKQSNNLFALDVKSGIRIPVTNNTFTISVGPRQCGYFLIGDDAFTAVPEAKEAVWTGAAAVSSSASGNPVVKNLDPQFRPRVAVELVTTWGNGANAKAGGFSRSRDAMLERIRFVTDEATLCKNLKVDDLEAFRANNSGVKTFSAAAFDAALAKANYVHFNGGTAANDAAFAACGEALKALLKRGGGILVDRNATGPAARKFFAEVGVYDPYQDAKRGIGDGAATWDKSFPTNHPYYASNKTNPGWRDGGYTAKLEGNGGSYSLAFTKWSDKQMAPFRAARDLTASEIVIQDKVLGAGKVVFNQNDRSFNDWYESKTYGNVILSWFIDMPVEEHAKKTRYYIGGIGEPVK